MCTGINTISTLDSITNTYPYGKVKHMAAIRDRRTFVKYPNEDYPESDITVIDGSSIDKEDYPVASVIIPTSDAYRNGYFPKLLEQLQEQSFQNFETIIIKGDPRQGRAINTGAAMARGDILITLDDDTKLGHNQVFENLVDAIMANQDIGMAGVANLVPEDVPWLVKRVMKEVPRRSSKLVSKIMDSDMAEHPCAAFPKRVFYEIGGENELIPRGLDPYLRSEIRKAGYRVVVIPDSWIHHLPPSSFKALLRQFFRNGKGSAYAQKFYPRWTIDTPNKHVAKFRERKSLPYRIIRKLVRMAVAFFRLHWIRLATSIAFSLGYIWGLITLKSNSRL